MRFLALALLCIAASAQAREVIHEDTTIRWSPERLSIVRGGKEKVIFQHREEKNKQGNVYYYRVEKEHVF